MKLQDILTENDADTIERIWQNIKNLVPASSHKEALAIIQNVGADEWYTDDDMEAIYAGLEEVFGADIADEAFAGLT